MDFTSLPKNKLFHSKPKPFVYIRWHNPFDNFSFFIYMNLQFFIRYHSRFGESLWLSGNTEELGMDDPNAALQMNYLNDEFWYISIAVNRKKLQKKPLSYKYYLKGIDGSFTAEQMDKVVPSAFPDHIEAIQLLDTWNRTGEYENAFTTSPFSKVLCNHGLDSLGVLPDAFTHLFKVKAPLLKKDEAVCILGSTAAFHEWNTNEPILLSKSGDWWQLALSMPFQSFPLAYKYGIYNTRTHSFVRYEEGDNRLIHNDTQAGKLVVLHDGFVHLPNATWKGAGVAIPVFSLRSKKSFGIGEFTDIPLLVDWAKQAKLQVIQLLPVNDTTATHTWTDSYPYAAISAFALQPAYINLEAIAGKKYVKKIASLLEEQERLNSLVEMDFEEVMRIKLQALKALYKVMGEECFNTNDYQDFYETNKHWLKPYAAFCYLRDEYHTPEFNTWPENSVYKKGNIKALIESSASAAIGFYYFVQYHLHLQLRAAAEYAHTNGVILKGDIAIGIYGNGCDAWMDPSLYHMHEQAGAPPDDFAVYGQNWGFPTYNWKRMQENGFQWWRQRFSQMSNYFDAFRIDHILGFFRIWSIPEHAVQGIMGRFVPAIPVHYVEFGENGIWFDEQRYCKPFITDRILDELFAELADKVKAVFLQSNSPESHELKPEVNTQKKVEKLFSEWNDTVENTRLREGLYALISNVILFKQEDSQGQEYHFRIDMEKTLSFKYLIPHVQEKLKALYVNYFYRRQDEFWKEQAMQKLPQLKQTTSMLICGEDLGMVPHCVPEVMQQLGILSLEIQRMPKDPSIEFFHPANAPYLSVVTPSTHDMSTIRGWWEEDRNKTQRFYNYILGQHGYAPYFCEAWINRAVVLQHLHSPAMWAIFQLQDLLGMSETLRRKDPHEERINVPANPQHYWRYRMHITLEELVEQKEFAEELADYIIHSGRIAGDV